MADDESTLDIATRLVHSGERQTASDAQPVAIPIYATATFTYESMEEIDRVFSGDKQGFIHALWKSNNRRARALH